MNSSWGKAVGLFLLMVLAVIAGIGIGQRVIPIIIDPVRVSQPVLDWLQAQQSEYHTIRIEMVNDVPQASSLTVKRSRRDYVQWENQTDHAFTLQFRDGVPSNPGNAQGPFEQQNPTIVVPPHSTTRYFRVDGGCLTLRYFYQSTTKPRLSGGPPDDPGMTVEP